MPDMPGNWRWERRWGLGALTGLSAVGRNAPPPTTTRSMPDYANCAIAAQAAEPRAVPTQPGERRDVAELLPPAGHDSIAV